MVFEQPPLQEVTVIVLVVRVVSMWSEYVLVIGQTVVVSYVTMVEVLSSPPVGTGHESYGLETEEVSFQVPWESGQLPAVARPTRPATTAKDFISQQ